MRITVHIHQLEMASFLCVVSGVQQNTLMTLITYKLLILSMFYWCITRQISMRNRQIHLFHWYDFSLVFLWETLSTWLHWSGFFSVWTLWCSDRKSYEVGCNCMVFLQYACSYEKLFQHIPCVSQNIWLGCWLLLG